MAWFKKNPKIGATYEVNNPKAKSKYYRKQVKKGAINKDGTPTSDYQRGKASGYIEALVDTNKVKVKRENFEKRGGVRTVNGGYVYPEYFEKIRSSNAQKANVKKSKKKDVAVDPVGPVSLGI